MPRLLVVHHTPSPALQEMFEAAVSGARTDEIDDVEVVIRPALTAAAADVLEADGYLLGTPANIGYMSGALKHFFDGIYYPCLEATRRRPYGLYVHGGMDTTGAVRAVESITTGLQWRAVRPPVTVTGPPGQARPGSLLGARRPPRRRDRGVSRIPRARSVKPARPGHLLHLLHKCIVRRSTAEDSGEDRGFGVIFVHHGPPNQPASPNPPGEAAVSCAF